MLYNAIKLSSVLYDCNLYYCSLFGFHKEILSTCDMRKVVNPALKIVSAIKLPDSTVNYYGLVEIITVEYMRSGRSNYITSSVI